MKKYSIILADPPWAYKVWAKKGVGRTAESHYPTMHIEDIRALPVGKLAAKDCALFLWVTMPTLSEAFSVIEAWGFTYKTVAFVWIKQNRKSPSLFWGLGHWTRANDNVLDGIDPTHDHLAAARDAAIKDAGLDGIEVAQVGLTSLKDFPKSDMPVLPWSAARGIGITNSWMKNSTRSKTANWKSWACPSTRSGT